MTQCVPGTQCSITRSNPWTHIYFCKSVPQPDNNDQSFASAQLEFSHFWVWFRWLCGLEQTIKPTSKSLKTILYWDQPSFHCSSRSLQRRINTHALCNGCHTKHKAKKYLTRPGDLFRNSSFYVMSLLKCQMVFTSALQFFSIDFRYLVQDMLSKHFTITS